MNLTGSLHRPQVIPGVRWAKTMMLPHEAKEEFIGRFYNKIHVIFNWERFKNEDWPIDIILLENNIDVNKWYTPWYVDLNGIEANYNAPNAIPLSINGVLCSEHIMNKRNKKVSQILMECKRLAQPIKFDIPAYELGNGKYLVLDGNHRIIALLKHGLRFVVQAFVLRGPIDEGIVADLLHWKSAI